MPVWQLPDCTCGKMLASTTRRPSDAVDAQLRVDHRHVVEPHLAGAGLVVIGVGAAPHEAGQRLVALHVRARHQLVADPRGEGRGGEDVAGQLHRLHQPVAVGGGAEVVGVDQRLVERVAARQLDPAARERPHHAGQDADRVRVALADDDVERHVDEGDLQIRPDPAGVGLAGRARSRRGSGSAAAPAACTRGSRR